MKKTTLLIVLLSIPFIYAAHDPSILYCLEMGYTYELVFDDEGDRAICIVKDGTSFDTWEFFNGEKGIEFNICSRYDLETVIEEEVSACVLNSGEVVRVDEFLEINVYEGFCGDGICSIEEYETCPEDCPPPETTTTTTITTTTTTLQQDQERNNNLILYVIGSIIIIVLVLFLLFRKKEEKDDYSEILKRLN